MKNTVVALGIFAAFVAGRWFIDLAIKAKRKNDLEKTLLSGIKQLAKNGSADAQLELGGWYLDDKDAINAFFWISKAAEQGHARALFNLGSMYQNGIGTKKDIIKAACCYTDSAAQGYASAQCNLGLMYYRGDGVSKDYLLAIKWLQEASEQGDDNAKAALFLIMSELEAISQ